MFFGQLDRNEGGGGGFNWKRHFSFFFSPSFGNDKMSPPHQNLFSHHCANIWHPHTLSPTVTRQMRQIIPPHTHYLNHVRPGHPEAKTSDWPLVPHGSNEEELVFGNVAALIKGAICVTIAYFVIAVKRWMSQRLWHHHVPCAPAN